MSEEKVAIITAGGSGMGADSARRLAADGFRVSILSSSGKGEALARELGGIGVTGSNQSNDDVRKLVDETMSKWGRVDVLVNSAGHGPRAPVLELSDEDWHTGMDIYFLNAVRPTRLVAPIMVEQGGGSITIIASIAGLKGNKTLGAYAISKVAEHQIARNLAVEYGPEGVRVNAIAPGLIKTDFAKALWTDPDRLQKVSSTLPLRRIGEPDEIAGMAVYLASRAGRFTTGQTLCVDGGVTIAEP